MFRWLPALEIAALRPRIEDPRDRVGSPDEAPTGMVRGWFGPRDADAAGPGLWMLRRPV